MLGALSILVATAHLVLLPDLGSALVSLEAGRRLLAYREGCPTCRFPPWSPFPRGRLPCSFYRAASAEAQRPRAIPLAHVLEETGLRLPGRGSREGASEMRRGKHQLLDFIDEMSETG